jgi:uncharacterized protein (TIGR00299 family) protein
LKTLYLECNMGAAGDMLMAALLELHDDQQAFIEKLNNIGLEGVSIVPSPSVKCGITGTQISVYIKGQEETAGHGNGHDHGHHHHDSHHHDEHFHGDMDSIEHIIGHLKVSKRVKKDAVSVYKLIAEAESHAHGVPISKIHFHEVGNLDAIADIVGVCMLMEELDPSRVVASPVHVGSGEVHCAHGVLPVPAPATAYILKDVPIYGGLVRGELCTPTGAALLKHFVTGFEGMPLMRVQKIGYGMGKKDFESANCVRAFIGEVDSSSEEVIELICNIDDMTPEAVAFACQLLFDEGALDVYTIPIGMKKGRTGILLTCMCRHGETDKFVNMIFKHTTTLGMRKTVSTRYTLAKEEKVIETKIGQVRIKTSKGYGTVKSKPEYDDIAGIAKKRGMALSDVLAEVSLED